MKNKLLLTLVACATLASVANVHATPKNTNPRTVQVHALCQNKTTRIMMIRELLNTPEGRQEMTRMLEQNDGSEFRSYYETHAVNPG